MLPIDISSSRSALAEFCRRWKVTELSVFGSAARGEARPDSDLDILVSFAPDADWGLLDHAAMQDELARILGKQVDLVSRRAVERSANWIRRRSILEGAVRLDVA